MLTRKKLISFLLSLIMILSVFTIVPFTASAEEADAAATGAKSGTTGDCTWTLDDNGVLTISGNGKMDDYDYDYSLPWGRSIIEVVIEDGVTSIGQYAFFLCRGLTSVTIPDSVTEIGDDAFSGCTGINEVSLSQYGVNKYKSRFRNINVKTIRISDSVTYIGGDAFKNQSSITDVIIGDSVEDIGSCAFYGCPSMTSVTIPANVTEIYEKAFGYYYREGFGESKVKNFTV